MTATRTRAKPGDVLEFKAAGYFAYLHYIGKHPEYGAGVLVSPGLYETSTAVTDGLFSGGYLTFYPATVAVAQGLVRVVGHLPPPSMPRRFRRPGATSGRDVVSWIVEDDAGEVVKTELSETDLLLPIASIWNHEYLVQRVAEHWNPAQEGRKA